MENSRERVKKGVKRTDVSTLNNIDWANFTSTPSSNKIISILLKRQGGELRIPKEDGEYNGALNIDLITSVSPLPILKSMIH